MTYMPKNDALRVLEPHLPRLCGCVQDALSTYYQGDDYAKVRYRHSPRTDASTVHDLIVDLVWQRFEGIPGVRCYERRGLKMIAFYGELTLRFKKFNSRALRSSNIPTGQSEAYIGQLAFEGMPDHARLQIGYVLNSLRTGPASIVLTHPNGAKNYWMHSLEEHFVASQLQLDEAFEEHAKTATPAIKRVRAKIVSLEEEAEQASS